MIKTIAFSAALLAATSPCSAKAPPHKPKAAASVKGGASWDSVERAIQKTVDGWESASAGCGSATRSYDDKMFSGGRASSSERDSLRSAKDRACNQKTGAETAILNALDDADKFLAADLAAKQKELSSASAEDKAEVNQDIADDKSRQKYVAKLRGQHSMGHEVNAHKR